MSLPVDSSAVAEHYARPDLISAIHEGVRRLGKTVQTVTAADLAAVDEFHIGGRAATKDLVEKLGLSSASHVLDVGSGIGGTARFIASHAGCQVTGIDLTAEYVATGAILCQWLGLDRRVSLQVASALAMPFPDAGFSAASMLHVGMNIPDKARLFLEIGRVLQAGALFGVYDVMRMAEGDLTFPLPWATSPRSNAVATPVTYRSALRSAGFEIVGERDRKDFAMAYFADQRARASGPAPPLGLHLLMGDRRQDQVRNMVAALASGLIAPVEIIARKT